LHNISLEEFGIDYEMANCSSPLAKFRDEQPIITSISGHRSDPEMPLWKLTEGFLPKGGKRLERDFL